MADCGSGGNGSDDRVELSSSLGLELADLGKILDLIVPLAELKVPNIIDSDLLQIWVDQLLNVRDSRLSRQLQGAKYVLSAESVIQRTVHAVDDVDLPRRHQKHRPCLQGPRQTCVCMAPRIELYGLHLSTYPRPCSHPEEWEDEERPRAISPRVFPAAKTWTTSNIHFRHRSTRQV